jgi:hypothetical protein
MATGRAVTGHRLGSPGLPIIRRVRRRQLQSRSGGSRIAAKKCRLPMPAPRMSRVGVVVLWRRSRKRVVLLGGAGVKVERPAGRTTLTPAPPGRDCRVENDAIVVVVNA